MPGPWPLVTALTCTLYSLLKYNIAIVYYLVDRNSFRKWCRWRQNLSPSGRELGLLMVSYSRWKSSNHLRIRSFGYKVVSVQTQSEITQKLRLVSGFETTGKLLFFLRQVSFVFPGFFCDTNNHEITSKQGPCDGWLSYNCMICQVYFSRTCSLPYHHPWNCLHSILSFASPQNR